VLDPGGFGAVTITKSITIDGGGGQVSSIIASGVNGIVVNAAGTDTVTIRNVRMNGLLPGPSVPGINGIQYIGGGTLIVENCAIYGFNANGINIAPSTNVNRVAIINTTLTNNGAAFNLRRQVER